MHLLVLTVVFGAFGTVGALTAQENWQAPQTRPAVLAVPTAEYSDSSSHYYGGAPAPSAAPGVHIGDLLKRQEDVSTTVCGVLASNTSWSYTCANNWVCGHNTEDRNNFGCCSSYIGSGVTGCYLPTKCYDYTRARTMSCAVTTGACAWSSLYCSNSLRPYCGEYVNEYGLTALDCFRSASWTYDLIVPNAALASTTTPPLGGTSSSEGSVSLTTSPTSPSSSATVSSSSEGVTVPYSQTQRTAGSTSSSNFQTSSSQGAAVGLSAIWDQESSHWQGCLMSLFLLFL